MVNRRAYRVTKLLLLFIAMIEISLQVYDVPSYYGHFSRRFFDPKYINSGTFTYFEYHYQVGFKFDNSTVYLANKHQHCIQKFDLNEGKKSVIAGRCGKPGDVIGDIRKTLFNYPSSILYYQYSSLAQFSQKSAQTYIVANQTCDLSSSGCILRQPYPSSLSLHNIRISPKIVLFPNIDTAKQQYLYVTDQRNHCIKRIAIKLGLVSVVAGQCGVSGFLDGPKGYNKLNHPSNIGMTSKGVIYFYDSGNQYMRKIETDGSVKTLLNGACKFYSESRSIGSYSLDNIICYEDWVQEYTKSPNQQHYYSPNTLEICKDHIIYC